MASALQNLTAQDIRIVAKAAGAGNPLALKIARQLLANQRADEIRKAEQEAAEDRLAEKVGAAVVKAQEDRKRATRDWDYHRLDPALRGILEPSAEQRTAQAVAKAAAEPTLEELRKAFEAQGLDPVLADMGERPLSAAERAAIHA